MASSGIKKDKYRYLLQLQGEVEKNIPVGGTVPLLTMKLVNKLFEEGRTKIWPRGSVEEKVQNLVKTWEMEFFHEACVDDFKTMDPKKYTFGINGYNPLLQTSPPEELRGYNPAEEKTAPAHIAFTRTFPRRFALEVLLVYCGHPFIVSKFRHWGFMEGPFKGLAPTGESVEFFGMALFFEKDEEERIVKVGWFFFDRGELFGGLLKGASIDSSAEAAASNCPVLRNTG